MLVLGIETSCDDTSAAVVRDGVTILSNVIASQVEVHRPWGGVVPEAACRVHLEALLPVIEEALARASTASGKPVGLADLGAIGVTNRPGLEGALLVGLAGAKALAYALGIPLVGVHHIEAHVQAAMLAEPSLAPPFLCLVVSGGHTELLRVEGFARHERLAQTRDDAAGEAFDKVAAMLGLRYPGGPEIDALAKQGRKDAVAFPIYSGEGGSLDFSFSGLKTAVLYHLKGQDAVRGGSGPARALEAGERADVAASFQEALVDQLILKVRRAVKSTGLTRVALGGGVACNARLREKLVAAGRRYRFEAFFPPPALCTDNAAMVAALAYLNLQAGRDVGLDLDARAR